MSRDPINEIAQTLRRRAVAARFHPRSPRPTNEHHLYSYVKVTADEHS